VTAIHGEGIDALMSAALAFLPKSETEQTSEGELPVAESEDRRQPRLLPVRLRLAIVGGPMSENLPSSIPLPIGTRNCQSHPGTTRDAVDVPFTWKRRGGWRIIC
jgi:predicted GTPase